MFVRYRWHAARYVRFGKGYTISHACAIAAAAQRRSRQRIRFGRQGRNRLCSTDCVGFASVGGNLRHITHDIYLSFRVKPGIRDEANDQEDFPPLDDARDNPIAKKRKMC